MAKIKKKKDKRFKPENPIKKYQDEIKREKEELIKNGKRCLRLEVKKEKLRQEDRTREKED